MKQTAKRILAMLCVTVMLFSCCLSGLTFAVSADTVEGGTTEYGNKWNIFYPGTTGQTLTYNAGDRFEKGVSGFNAQIPETYTMNDLAVYMHITLDQAGVTAFEKSGTVELSQSTMDQAERYWSLTSPTWKVGENFVLFPLGSSGSAPGSQGVAFDLYQPINYFRMFATPNSAEFTAASSVTIWEIAIVDKTAAGVEFGADDTYLQLSAPIGTTPNSIEASVKVPAPKTEWVICNDFASNKGFSIGWSNGTSAATYGNEWAHDESLDLQPEVGTYYAEFKPNGKTNTSGDHQVWCPVFTSTFDALDIPKSVGLNDLQFSGWVYVSDVSAVETTSPWFWISSTSDYAVSSGGLKYSNMFADLKSGWNYFEVPLSDFAPSAASYPLDINDISGISMRAINLTWLDSTPDDGVAGTIEDQVTVRYADFRLSVIGSEEEEEKLPTSWSIGYPNGGRYFTTKETIYDAAGNSGAPHMVNLGTGIAKDNWGIPNGTPYYAVTVNKGGQMAMAHQSFTVDFPEEYTKDDLALAFWMYTSTGEIPGGYLELTSSGTWDKQEIAFYPSKFVTNPRVGWNYVLLPLSSPNSATSGTDNVFDYTNANFIRWCGSGAMAAVTEIRISEMKFIAMGTEEATEWQLGNAFTASSGFHTGWSNGSSSVTYNNVWLTDSTLENQPMNGTPYAEFTANGKTAANGLWSPVFTETFTALDIPDGVELNDLKFSGWMYISDASTVQTNSPWFWLSTSSAVSNGGLTYSNLFNNYPLSDGWNYFEIPLSAFKQNSTYPLTVDTISAICMRSLNLTWLDSTPDDGVAGTIEDQAIVRYADFKLSLISDEEAAAVEEWYISKNGAGVASGSAASGVSDGSGSGYNTLPKGLSYTIGSNMGAGASTFNAAIPETYTQDDIAMSFWLWVDDVSTFSGTYVELTSSGTCDKEELYWNLKDQLNKGNITLQNGWNYIYLPLSWAGKGSTTEFNLYNANYARIHTKGCLIGVSDMKLVLTREAQLEKEDETLLYSMWSSAKSTMVTDGSAGEPAGLPYHQSVFTANHWFLNKKFTTVSVPAGSIKRDLCLNFWLYVDDVTKIADIGNIELSSSGKCDSMEYERDLAYLLSTLNNGWNFVSIPLATGWSHNTTGGNFNEFAINYVRWHSMTPVDGETATVRIANLKISSASGEYPNWDFVHWDKGWGRQAGGSTATYTCGNLISDYLPVGPSTGNYYAELTPATSVAAGTNWYANMQINRSDGSIENEWLTIPSSYRREHLMASFWLYINDADLLDTSKQPVLYIGSDTGYSTSKSVIKYQFSDFSLVDGWNRITVPLSEFTDVDGTYSIETTRVFWFSNFYVGYDAVVRYADIRIEATADPTLTSSDVNVTADDMVIFGNTNTADENPIALFTNVKNNVCWVWGDKQYNTDFNVATGEWIDLALVRDMTAGKFYLYANGEVVAEADATDTADIVPTVAHTIGADGLGVPFSGMIADVRVWSDARTAEEIEAGRVKKVGNKTNGLTAETEGLIDAWFLLGDLTHILGDTVTDSVKGNDLIFKGSRADDWFDYDQTQYDFLYDENGNPDYYTMVFIPDIQNLVTGKYTEWWMAEAQWIADNIEKENIVHVVGAGDSTWNNTVAEYERAKAGFDLFADKVSWSNLIGNHDYVWSNPTRDTTRYNTYFGLDYINATKGGENFVDYFVDPYGISTAENAYYRFKVNGVQWMILQLEFHPRAHVLTWANEILAQYPNDNVILTTHSYLNGVGDYCAQNYTYINGTNGVKGESDAQYGGYIGDTPEKVWTEVAYNNPNVKMILCGHSASSDCSIVYREDANVDGYMVPQMMINAQNLDNNDSQTGGYFADLGVGLLGIMRFSKDGTQVAMQYYSPYYEKSYSPSSNEITLALDIENCTHANTTVTDASDATCTVDGSTGTETCDDCGAVVREAEVIPAAHTIEDKAQIDATCTENGVTAGGWCSVCKQYITGGEVIEALGHNEVTEKVDATCTENGSITVKCDVCGEVLSTEIIEATGHNEVTTTVDATCTENGSITVKCDVCGEVLSTEIIEATGHNEVTTTVDATCTENGSITVTCDVCGEVLSTEIIEATGHNEVTTTVDATCTENGSITVTCDVCGETLSVTVIEATGHDEGTLEGAYDPTLTEPGYEGDIVCGKCGDVITAGAVIPTLTPGVIDENGYYREDGKRVPYKGLILVDGEYYYVNDHGLVLKDVSYTILDTNGYESLDARIQSKATYYFDANGHMIFEKNGIYGGVYYENDKKVPYAGLVEVDGNLYYVVEKGNVVTGRYFISNLNEMEGFSNGYYFFDENGVMNTAAAVVDGYYYADGGKCTAYAGLVEVDGDYYYVLAKGEVKLGRYSIVKHNDLKAKGLYCFGADGKMVIDGVYDGYYYNEEGKSESYLGLVEAADGNYYYVVANGKIIVNNPNYFVTTTNGLVAKGRYAFDENGAMLLVDTYEELVAALKTDSYVSLAGDITVNGNISLPAGATLNGNGYTLKAAQLYMGEGSTVRRVVFDGTALVDGSNIYAHDVSVTVDTCTFRNPDYEAIQATTKVAGVTIVINSCTFLDETDTAYRYVHVELVDALRGDANNGVKLVLTGNRFLGIDSCDNDGITVAGVLAENLTVSGNTATAASVEAANAECWFGERTTGAWVTYDVTVFDSLEQA